MQDCRPATVQQRSWDRMRQHLLGQLACLGRHTLTGVTATTGAAFADWSAQYRLYSQQRVDPEAVFAVVRRHLQARLDADQPMVVALDDSLLRKSGTKTYGVAYRRDPLGPPFQVNLVRGQRVLQLSAALPDAQRQGARMIPVAFSHVPTPVKPGPGVEEAAQSRYRQACRQSRINLQGREAIVRLRSCLDQDPAPARALWVVVDGRFTNRTVLRDLPERTLLIGRIRGDAKLYHLPPETSARTGRRRLYGPPALTPEQLRQAAEIPWQRVSAWATGRCHEFRLKVLSGLRWRATADRVQVQIVVIAPLAYRLSPNHRVLYRQPAYLVCTDPTLSLPQLLQAYLWRWDIEVNFRDEKTLLGVGQAQVRHPASTQSVPALAVAAYALLLLAAHRVCPTADACLPPPKWRKTSPRQRSSLTDLISLLRHDLWGQAIRAPRFSDFTSRPGPNRKSEKPLPSLHGALFYAPA